MKSRGLVLNYFSMCKILIMFVKFLSNNCRSHFSLKVLFITPHIRQEYKVDVSAKFTSQVKQWA